MFKIGLPCPKILSKSEVVHVFKNGVKDPPHDSVNFLIMHQIEKKFLQKVFIFVKLRDIWKLANSMNFNILENG